jgi:hypothetical protein
MRLGFVFVFVHASAADDFYSESSYAEWLEATHWPSPLPALGFDRLPRRPRLRHLHPPALPLRRRLRPHGGDPAALAATVAITQQSKR